MRRPSIWRTSSLEKAVRSRTVWRDAGAVRAEAVRKSFMKTTETIGRPEATCPKPWRHVFAAQLQDGGVDPLIRQLTLGHKPTGDAGGSLGMTARYAHSRMGVMTPLASGFAALHGGNGSWKSHPLDQARMPSATSVTSHGWSLCWKLSPPGR